MGKKGLTRDTSEEATIPVYSGNEGTHTLEKNGLVVSRNTAGSFEKQDADFLET